MSQKLPKATSDRRMASGKRPDLYLHSNKTPSKILDNSAAWNPKHFRLFVGNLGPDATSAMLTSAFSKYATLSRADVPKGKDGENKGYGFVAFVKAEDYLAAFKEMNGKYVGLRPVQLKRADGTIKKQKKR